jgi:uncharacterized membrane protein
MRAKSALSVVAGAFALLGAGAGEAWSQNALVQICNRSSYDVLGVITANPSSNDSRWLISGWYRVGRGSCRDIKYVPAGHWIYMYAEADGGSDNWWGENNRRFCVTYPGPFERYISDDYNCGGFNLKQFKSFFVDTPTFTWNLYD